jgi:RimJ/RimL family protein N-acetyltransferase
VIIMRLEPYRDEDLTFTESLEFDPIVMRHLGGAGAPDRARAVHGERLAGIERGDLYRTVIPDGGTAPVALVAIWRTEWRGETIHEFGIMVRPEAHRQGLGLAASRQIIAEFRAARPAEAVHAFTAIGNEAADGGARRLVFVPDGEYDMDYAGEPLRCRHWVLAPSASGPR